MYISRLDVPFDKVEAGNVLFVLGRGIGKAIIIDSASENRGEHCTPNIVVENTRGGTFGGEVSKNIGDDVNTTVNAVGLSLAGLHDQRGQILQCQNAVQSTYS